MGFCSLLPAALQAPIITTFHMPADKAFVFTEFYGRLRDKGFAIYPGKLTVTESFRVGCIGCLGAPEMNAALSAIRTTLAEMGVATGAPALAT